MKLLMVPILPVVGIVTNHHQVVRLDLASKIRFENHLKFTFKQIQFPRSAHRSARRNIHNFEALFVHLVQLVDDVLAEVLAAAGFNLFSLEFKRFSFSVDGFLHDVVVITVVYQEVAVFFGPFGFVHCRVRQSRGEGPTRKSGQSR